MRSDKSDAIAVSSSITRIVSISNRATWIGSSCKAPRPPWHSRPEDIRHGRFLLCCYCAFKIAVLLLGLKVGPQTRHKHTRCCKESTCVFFFSFQWQNIHISSFAKFLENSYVSNLAEQQGWSQTTFVADYRRLSQIGQTILALFCTTCTETFVHWKPDQLHLGVSLLLIFCL